MVGILYYRLDFPLLLQEFYWQTEDIVPDLPRVHRFLNYWRLNIEATIREVNISYE
jgi:uncharacterized protein Usg